MSTPHETLRNTAVIFSLRRTPVFAGLPEDDLAMIAELSVLKTYRKGEYLFRQRELAHGFFIVRRGIINVHRVGTDGREQVIHLFRPGESFAENSLFNESGYLTDARSVGESEAILVPKWEFLQILRQRSDIGLRMLSSMSEHMRGLILTLENVTLKDAETRLMNWILHRCPRPLSHKPAEVAIGMTKTMLSAELGTRQETLSRTLAKLREAGLIAVRGRTLKIPDPLKLKAAFQSHLGGGSPESSH
ncbi:MAG: Crp/Fnr family transcriptional regulator [Verrucomicrobiae bacterium]